MEEPDTCPSVLTPVCDLGQVSFPSVFFGYMGGTEWPLIMHPGSEVLNTYGLFGRETHLWRPGSKGREGEAQKERGPLRRQQHTGHLGAANLYSAMLVSWSDPGFSHCVCVRNEWNHSPNKNQISDREKRIRTGFGASLARSDCQGFANLLEWAQMQSLELWRHAQLSRGYFWERVIPVFGCFDAANFARQFLVRSGQ